MIAPAINLDPDPPPAVVVIFSDEAITALAAWLIDADEAKQDGGQHQ